MNARDIATLKEKALAEIDAAPGADDLERLRIAYLGRNGLLPSVMDSLKNMAPSERPLAGRAANDAKQAIAGRIDERRAQLQAAPGCGTAGAADWSLPGAWRGLGSRHPITQVIEEAIRIWARLGFTVADGPDIETEHNNFDALNTPADHPSRDIQDTFWIDDKMLLRTHTSPVQIRVMENRKPPVRIIAPGRCYRRDTTDATHSANFHQVEGLYVDRSVSMADLKGDITYFAQQMMGAAVKVRFRPHYFPFTEPSVEYDFSCHVCAGRGCRVCKNSGWIEISGAGMVAPQVFESVGYDPEQVVGYAFGMGVERIAMIRYGVDDIRLFYENDVRFLAQFA